MQRIALLVGVVVLGCGDNNTAGEDTRRVAGEMWADANGDGVRDAGEAALEGVTVFLDLDSDGILDAGEPMAQTAAGGAYELPVDAPGSYRVQQVLPFGFRSGLAPAKPRPTSIIGGGDVAVGEYPFMVGVGFLFDDQVFQFCGGVLISDRHVISAAHCSEGQDPAESAVLVGTIDPFEGTGLLVDSITVHPMYDGDTEHGFDIALWTLSEPADLAALGIATVEMLTPATAALADPDVLATTLGWGVSDRPTSLLQQVHLPVVAEADCTAVYEDATNFDTQICAGAVEGGIDSCQGDSGGPILVRDGARGVWMHAGVTSWGDGCALPGTPGVYARTSALSEWVMSEALEPGAFVQVTVGDGTATADFPTQSTTRPAVGAIEARWQLTGMSLPDTIAADTALDVSWGIISEDAALTGFACAFDPDGVGPLPAQTVACGLGTTTLPITGFATGIFPVELTVSRSPATFSRRVNVFSGTPASVSTSGALTTQDPLDPDYFDPYRVDYFVVGGLDGTRAFAVEANSSAFDTFITLYDLAQRDFANGGGILAFGDRTETGGNRVVVVPEAGRTYLIGVSSFGPNDTGAYEVSIINDGTLTGHTP